MTPTQITKLIEHYGLPEGLGYFPDPPGDHASGFYVGKWIYQGDTNRLSDYFGLILLAHHIKEQREKTAYFFMQNEPVNEILTAALEIIE